MKPSTALRDFLVKKEGLHLNAYLCPANVWTIGVGATIGSNGKPVKKGDTITHAQAMQLLDRDMARFAEQVRRLVQVNLTQGQFDALVSFAFNMGGGALERSTLLKKLNKGDYKGAAKEFDKWVYEDKRKLKGLVTRRAEERRMFEQYGGEYSYSPDPNNEPLRNRDLPLPTVMRNGAEPSPATPVKDVAAPVAVATVGAGGIGAVLEVANQATPIANALSYLDWRVGIAIVAVIVVGGLIWWLKSNRG